MVPLKLSSTGRKSLKILCLGAHSDDIEIGCGGTILKLIAEYPEVEVHWIVLSSTPERDREARKSASLFLKGTPRKTVVVKHFRTSFFPYQGEKIKSYFETLKRVSPDLIFTHYRHDLHQDHRVVCDLTWNTFRNHLILEYEIPKYDGDLGTPNCFMHLDESTSQMKVRSLLSVFGTQRDKHWFTEDTFLALMRLRGVESGAPEKYAEAFYSRKFLLS
jgi:LmbE family N-acetylglucosaminyl deacetylase